MCNTSISTSKESILSDPSLFGIPKPQWEIIAALATALSATASFAAVWVALHLAKRVSIPKVKFTVGHRVMVTQGEKGPYPEYVLFNVVNTGERIIRISQIGWRVGLLKKRFAIQTFDPRYSSKLPVELTHGQEANYFVPLADQEEPWLAHFAKRMMMPNRRTSCATLRATLITSVGNQFIVKPQRNLVSKLREECDALVPRQSLKP